MESLGVSLLIAVITFCFIISRSIANHNRNADKGLKSFWENEAKANATRKTDISSLDYITVDVALLPMDKLKEAGFENLAEQLDNLSTKKIINLSMYSNTDLKLMYGAANLNELSDCDNNYTLTIRLLNKIGKVLIDAGKNDLAMEFLSYGISIGSDISTTYLMLAELYKANGQDDELDQLIIKAGALNSISKSAIINKLNNIKSESK